MIDPEMGVGAYQISGGASGGTLLEGVSYLLTQVSEFILPEIRG